MSLVTTKERVLHYAPSANYFFSGGGGYQVLAKVFYLFGYRIWSTELDRETVPHFHYVQQRTLGLSEWKSKFAEQIKRQTEETI